MRSVALGRYLPLNSVVNRMDPRAKILILLVMMIAIFIPAGFWGYIPIVLFIALALGLSKLKLSFALRSLKPMVWMMVFLLVVNVLVMHNGHVVLALGGFKIYSDALIQTAYIVIRLTLMIILTTLLTATTKPLDLTLGIEKLLKPFEAIGLPAHIIAMMISIALRFIPTLIEETQRIMNAQASRGIDMQNGTLKEKISAVLALIVPLFVSAFDRAEQLANAMEARGYDPIRPRTRYKTLKMTHIDWVGMTLALLVLATDIVLAVMGV